MIDKESLIVSINGIGLTSRQDRMTLIESIESMPAGDVLEIGVYLGGNLILAAKTLQTLEKSGKIYGIDPLEIDKDAAGKFVKGGGYFKTDPFPKVMKNIRGLEDRIIILREDSKSVAWSEPVSLLIVDGCHTLDYVLHDLSKFSKWVVPGGIILAHDYDPEQPAWKQAYDAIHEFSRLENWPFEARPNFAIFQRPR